MEITGESAFDIPGGLILRETIFSNNAPVVLRRGLWDPGPVWLTEVDVEEASTYSEAIVPLKSIHQ